MTGTQGSNRTHVRGRRWGLGAVACLAVIGAVIVVQRSGDPASSPPATTEPSGPLGSGGARPLGTVSDVGPSTQSETCPLDSCLELTVACPGLPDTTAVLAIGTPTAPPRGAIAFFSGGTGRSWWADEGNRADAAVLAQIGDAGLEVTMVRWIDGWARLPGDGATGFAAASCRPATVVRWLHDERYEPMGLSPAPGTCGFCISGNSGGSSQAAYSLTHYGLAGIVDAAILSSGPPHAALAKGCLRTPGEEAYWYDPGNILEIDGAYGGGPSGGACAAHDPAMADQWAADGVDTGGTDYAFDATRVVVILGSNDRTVAPVHAEDFVAKLRASGSPWVTEVTADRMSHGVTSSPDGRQQLVDAVLGAP